MAGAFIIFPASLLALLLLVAAWGDWRTRTISNGLNGAIALLAPLWWYGCGLSLWPDVAFQVALAAVVFLIFFAAFVLRMMGGGDVKLITALALWFVPQAMAQLIVIMALAGGVLTLAMLIHHKWTRAAGKPEIPYGLAISGAGLWIIANHILTISST